MIIHLITCLYSMRIPSRGLICNRGCYMYMYTNHGRHRQGGHGHPAVHVGQAGDIAAGRRRCAALSAVVHALRLVSLQWIRQSRHCRNWLDDWLTDWFITALTVPLPLINQFTVSRRPEIPAWLLPGVQDEERTLSRTTVDSLWSFHCRCGTKTLCSSPQRLHSQLKRNSGRSTWTTFRRCYAVVVVSLFCARMSAHQGVTEDYT